MMSSAGDDYAEVFLFRRFLFLGVFRLKLKTEITEILLKPSIGEVPYSMVILSMSGIQSEALLRQMLLRPFFR